MSVTFHTLRGADFPEKFKILMFRLTWEPGPEPKRFMQILIYKCYIGHCWMPLIVISDVRYWRTKTECWNKIQGDLPSCQISCLLGTRSINSLPLHWTSRCGRSPTLCLIPSLSVPNSEAFQKSATYSLGVEQQTAEVMSLPRASAANSSSVNLEQFLCISVSILQCSQILPVIQ